MADKYPNHTWEAIKVSVDGTVDATKEDGTVVTPKYELTMFKVWNEEARDENLGPVFFQHGGT